MKRDKARLAGTEILPLGLPQHRQALPPELCEHVGFMLAKAHQEIFTRMGQVTAPTVLNMIDDLEGAGFVKRSADPSDRRANAVKPTPKGIQWLEKLRPVAEEVE